MEHPEIVDVRRTAAALWVGAALALAVSAASAVSAIPFGLEAVIGWVLGLFAGACSGGAMGLRGGLAAAAAAAGAVARSAAARRAWDTRRANAADAADPGLSGLVDDCDDD